jgi:hypothetical protein
VSSTDTPLLVAPVYGLRTWTVRRDGPTERLAGPHQGTTWPPGGEWIEAGCSRSAEHRPPVQGCNCGVHAWHPSKRAAKRVLSGRREVPGIVELRGTTEVHEEGLRGERARPRVLFLLPGRNARLIRRLADAHGAQVVEARGADDVLRFCRSGGLGLDESTVAGLLGPVTAAKSLHRRRERMRRDALRIAVAVALAALMVVGGLRLATDPPGERVLKGRAGEIRVNSR